MKTAFEAVWEQGQIIPKELIHLNEHARLLVVILDELQEASPIQDWQRLKGKYQGKLSSVSEFIQEKQEEKRIER